ncbi:MAG: outer membrane beta-barrel protein [Deltaproteobacteria bacterium]|nr:outer membrane beta-barrel protein [Deltaproteobacteria bacterium]
MKLFACALSVFAVCSLLPSMMAYGDDGGFYVELKLGASSQQVDRKIVANDRLTDGAGSTLNSKFVDLGDYKHGAFGGGFALGYDFFPRLGWPLRAELEFLARSYKNLSQTRTETLNATINLGVPGNQEISVTESSKIGIHTLLLNLYYDFHTESAFTPFIGAGLGIAILHGRLEHARIEAPGPGIVFENDLEGDYGDAQFAWALSAGVNYALNSDWSLDLSYKFVNAGNNSYTSDIADVGLESKFKLHDVMLGLRYTF